MYQVIQAILNNPKDHTKISLIFANVTEDDILLRKEARRERCRGQQQHHAQRFASLPLFPAAGCLVRRPQEPVQGPLRARQATGRLEGGRRVCDCRDDQGAPAGAGPGHPGKLYTSRATGSTRHPSNRAVDPRHAVEPDRPPLSCLQILRCGPPPMMTILGKHLDSLGYPKEQQFQF